MNSEKPNYLIRAFFVGLGINIVILLLYISSYAIGSARPIALLELPLTLVAPLAYALALLIGLDADMNSTGSIFFMGLLIFIVCILVGAFFETKNKHLKIVIATFVVAILVIPSGFSLLLENGSSAALCGVIKTDTQRCYRKVASKNRDISICKEAPRPGVCEYDFLMSKEGPGFSTTTCAMISTEYWEWSCMQNNGIIVTTEYCNTLQDNELKIKCIKLIERRDKL